MTRSNKARQSKSVTFMYGGIAGILLVAIATIALVVQPPSPPALAEFAPQAEKTIEEAPDEQSSQFGKDGTGDCAAGQQDCSEGGEGAGLGGGGTPKPTTPPPPPPEDETSTVIDVKRVRRCVGDPPRQTEDPQSPPCVNYFVGDNGGATSPGVTRDEIRVVVNQSDNGLPFENFERLADYFNRRYEFYGRKLRVTRGKDLNDTPQWQRAAADAAAEAKAFAGVGFALRQTMQPYRARLADHKIISVMPDDDNTSEADLAALHPFAWNYNLSYDRLGTDLGEFVCQSLVRHNADHAGPVERSKTRVFAVLKGEPQGSFGGAGAQGDPAPLVARLRACDAPFVFREYRFKGGTPDSERQALMAELQRQGVTTILPVSAQTQGPDALAHAASRIGFQPEWLLMGGGDNLQFNEFVYQQWPPEQSAHLFSLRGWNKGLPVHDRPSTWAYEEVGGDTGALQTSQSELEDNYHAFLLLASGIQAAGPRLTPESFAKALQGLKFPNPGAGAAPYYQATVGFAGDHTMIDDEALQWWSAKAPSTHANTESEAGGFCYIDLGARWRTGQWPKRTYPFFDLAAPCR